MNCGIDEIKTQKCFKMVRVINGELVSVTASSPPYRIVYSPGSAIRAILGTMGCMAFDSLESIRWFESITPARGQIEVWQAELTNPIYPQWLLHDINNTREVADILDYLAILSNRRTLREWSRAESLKQITRFLPYNYRHCICEPPQGTICGDTLKLIKKVEYKDKYEDD